MKLRSVFAGALGAMMMSESAFALSCARPDLVRTLEQAKASPKLYHILVGRFVSNSPRTHNNQQGGYISPQDQFKPKPPILTRTMFVGFSIAKSPHHDQHLMEFPVDIETSCIGPWCSNVPTSDQSLIAFVEARDGQAPLLRISPCPSDSFRTDDKKIQKIRQCLDRTCDIGQSG